MNAETCEGIRGSGNFQPHDWRLIEEGRVGNLRDGGEVRRRWYCTRCRKVETTAERLREDT